MYFCVVVSALNWICPISRGAPQTERLGVVCRLCALLVGTRTRSPAATPGDGACPEVERVIRRWYGLFLPLPLPGAGFCWGSRRRGRSSVSNFQGFWWKSFNQLHPVPAGLRFLPLLRAVSWQTWRLYLQRAV